MSKIYSRPRLRMPRFVFYKKREKVKSRKRASLVFIVIIAFTTLKIILNAVNPIFDKLCENKAISMATIISNNKATEVMKNHTYNELFTIEKDEMGNVSLLKANVVNINEITSEIAVKIQEEIDKLDAADQETTPKEDEDKGEGGTERRRRTEPSIDLGVENPEASFSDEITNTTVETPAETSVEKTAEGEESYLPTPDELGQNFIDNV